MARRLLSALALTASAAAALLLAPCAGPTDGGSGGGDLPGADASSPPPEPLFQASMASALPYRGSTGGSLVTFRIPFTNMRAGTQVKVALRAGGGGMKVRAAWLGRWAGGGDVLDNVQLSFGGAPGVKLGSGAEAVSDAAEYDLRAGDRLAVSFEAEGSVPAALDIENDGVVRSGAFGADPHLAGDPEPAVRGVQWVSVLGPPQQVIAVLGDSIGAGSAASGLDERFIAVAQWELGRPVIDASVGGDGILRALARLERDVLKVPGVTDCVVQVGTNDLHREDPEFLINNLSEAYRRLRAAGIAPWGATILPKNPGILTAGGERTRQAVNDFIRGTDLVDGYVDFAALSEPGDPSAPLPGILSRDGIHPSSEGHRAMGLKLVEAFRTP